MRIPTLFLSAASDDLGAWRTTLHKAFERAGCKVFTQDHSMGASTGDVLLLLRRHLEKSDFVIHLAGLAYGDEPDLPPFPDHPDFVCSFTQFEYYYSHLIGKAVIAFVCAPEFPFSSFMEKGRHEADRERRRLLQHRHRERVATGRPAGSPLEGRPYRPLSEPIADVKALLAAVAAAVGTIRDSEPGSGDMHAVLAAAHADFTRLSLEARSLDISRIVRNAPVELVGREAELEILNAAWGEARRADLSRRHVLTFVALAGQGKTSLVAKWAVELARDDWPGCDSAFAWSFYDQGTAEKTAESSDLFFKEALTFFGDPIAAASALGANAKARRLAQLLFDRRVVLILDGVEALQCSPSSPTPGELKDQGLAALLRGLASANRGLCILTTRYSIPDLRAFRTTVAPEHQLSRLSAQAGVDLLQRLGVRKDSATRREFDALVADVDGHALTLTLLAGFLRRAFNGDLRQRDRVRFEAADHKVQGGHAFRTIAAYQQWLLEGGDEGRREVAVLKLLGLFDRPAAAGCISALRAARIAGLTEPLNGLADDDWNFTLTGLEEAKLLTIVRDPGRVLIALDAHPLVREYFGTQVEQHQPDAWRDAHRCLYEYLAAATKDQPDATLDDLQPLYQAVRHGCLAGLHQDAYDTVYDRRIIRSNKVGSQYYSITKLGAIGSDLAAVSGFFSRQWDTPVSTLTAADQALVLAQAAFYLKALGRLTEAFEPMRAGLEMSVRWKAWMQAAIQANNLSELTLELGGVAEAARHAEQSVSYADQSGDASLRIYMRTTRADVLHQAGLWAQANACFDEAERLQAESEPGRPFLRAVPGFRHADLLLTLAEQEAWQVVLGGKPAEVPPPPLPESPGRLDSTIDPGESAGAVVMRVKRIVESPVADSLLSVALSHLTAARAGLYSLVIGTPDSDLETVGIDVEAAVDGLRRAGQLDELPKALMTRAWFRSLTKRLVGADSAHTDLEETWEILARGPMLIRLADLHLYRARLFFREGWYPWESPRADLADARALIERAGYWRRKHELEAAEEAVDGLT